MKTVTRGIMHGKTIELPQDLGLPEGQEVTLTVEPVVANGSVVDALRRSAGGWAEDADELDRYLEWNRLQRKASRQDLDA